jgi:flagellar basal body P-ring protein FlgI
MSHLIGQRLMRLTCAIATIAALAASGCSKKPPQTARSEPRFPPLPPKEVPEYLKGAIVERVYVAQTAPKPVSGYGLVANLWGTGDSKASNAVREYLIRTMEKRGFGSKVMGLEDITPERVLRDPRFAVVRVEGLIPPGARPLDRFDVVVSAEDINDTSSLAHGQLYRTVLKEDGANPRTPSAQIEEHAFAEGGLFVNPAYALELTPGTGAARASLRNGVIIGGGVVQIERPLMLRLWQPGFRESRAIDQRLDLFFQDAGVAQALNEGVVELHMPARFRGDWEHFMGLVTHVFFNDSPTFRVNKARELATVAQGPDAPLMDISYSWEALGEDALPFVTPLMTHARPEVAFAAARAAAFSGDTSAQNVLIEMARKADHPVQLNAVQTLGKVRNSPEINALLRSLLASEHTLVRLEAYRALAEAGDTSIYTKLIPDQKLQQFALDIVPGDGPPLIYASRRGIPRLAVFGRKPSLTLPVTFTTMEGKLSISSQPGQKTVTIFYRGPGVRRPVTIVSNPDIAEIAARLGGAGPADEANLHFNYCDVVAVVQALADQQKVAAQQAGKPERVSAAFVLQEIPQDTETVFDAPPGQQPTERPQTSEPPGTVSSAAGPR